MKKPFLLFLLAAYTFSNLSAQNFQGFNSSRYAGIHGVYLNPASISSSNYRWDVNLFSIHASVQNNNATLNLNDIKNGFDTEKLLDQISGDGSKSIDALANLEILGPSFMIKAGKKSAFALSTRARVLTALNDIDGKLLNQLTDEAFNYPININVNALQQMAATGWAEAGITYSHHIYASSQWDIHGGITLKALGGGINGYVFSDQLNVVIDDDATGGAYATNSNGRMGFGFSGPAFGDVNVKDIINFNNLTPGFDIGFTFLKKEDALPQPQEIPNGYKWKFGVSVLDIGSLKFEQDPDRSGAYNVDINSNERFFLSEFDDLDIDDINGVFKSNPQYFSPIANQSIDGTYKVSLPTRLMADVDYHLKNNWYINMAGQISLVKASMEKPFNSAYYSGITLTPRYDARSFGVWLPLHYNPVTSFNAGFGFRAGPLIIGSGSVISALMGNSKQADAFIGFRFGGLGAKKVKTPKEAADKE